MNIAFVGLGQMGRPMATRLLMTLTYLGHDKVSYLDGGLPKWMAEKRQVVQVDPTPARGSLTARPRPDPPRTSRARPPQTTRAQAPRHT